MSLYNGCFEDKEQVNYNIEILSVTVFIVHIFIILEDFEAVKIEEVLDI